MVYRQSADTTALTQDHHFSSFVDTYRYTSVLYSDLPVIGIRSPKRKQRSEAFGVALKYYCILCPPVEHHKSIQ